MLHNLGTALSREQMKNVVGGFADEEEGGGGGGNGDGEGKSCVNDSDCGSKDVECNGTVYTVSGHCYTTKKTCSWTAVC